MTYRLLVTGSRTWVAASLLYAVLDDMAAAAGLDELVLVHGRARTGADALADRWAINREVDVEAHPARWSREANAGHVRNARMVKAGADAVVAFRHYGRSNGTDGCINAALRHGLDVVIFTPDDKPGVPFWTSVGKPADARAWMTDRGVA